MGNDGSNPVLLDQEPVRDSEAISIQLSKESSFDGKGKLDAIMTEEVKEAEKVTPVKSENDILNQTFQGKLTTIINFKDKDGKDGQKVVDDKFSDILLNVSQGKDFYAVWDDAYTCTIDNFAQEEGHYVKAEKIDWIEEIPNVLTFQMNRL